MMQEFQYLDVTVWEQLYDDLCDQVDEFNELLLILKEEFLNEKQIL